MQKDERLYLNKDEIVTWRGKDRVLYKYNAIVLPQLYQTELLITSHDHKGHQGIDKVYQINFKCYEWPGMKKKRGKNGKHDVCHIIRLKSQEIEFPIAVIRVI